MSQNPLGVARRKGLLHRILDSDMLHSFKSSPTTVVSAGVPKSLLMMPQKLLSGLPSAKGPWDRCPP